MKLERIPPHDLESERLLLACIFADSKNIHKVELEIQSADFYNTSNQRLYEKIIAFSKKQTVDHHAFSISLKTDKELLIYLLSLDLLELQDCPLDLNFYISQVKNCSGRRKQIELAYKVLNDAYNEQVDQLANVEELKQYLERATLREDASIVEVSQIFDKIDHLYRKGLQPGISTGWPALDRYYTVRPGEVTLITGIPSHGKSTWNSNLFSNIAMRYGWKLAVFSPENQPLERYAAHIAQLYVQKSFSPHQQGQMTEGELEYAKDWMNNHFVFIQPRDDELQFSSILKKAVICCLRHGIKGLVIDPWNEVDHTRPQGLSETEYISKCLSKLRYFARTYQVHIWLIAHPTKLMKRQDGNYPIPTPYDISGSAHFRNKADCCLCVWRDLDPDSPRKYETDIYIQKIRFHEVGQLGKVTLTYNPILQKYD